MIIKHWFTAEHKHMLSHYSLPELLMEVLLWPTGKCISLKLCHNSEYEVCKEAMRIISFFLSGIMWPVGICMFLFLQASSVCIWIFWNGRALYKLLSECVWYHLVWTYVWQAHLQNQLYMFVILTFGVTLHGNI